MILAFIQIKGGVGKTTLAVNLTVERTLRGKRDVLLIDADDQGTASDFVTLRTERLGSAGFVAIPIAGPELRERVLEMRKRFDDIVIDVGGRDSAALRAALTVADLAVLPFQPRSFDIWTIDKMAALVAEAQGINPALQAVAVINCADTSGSDNQAAAEALKDSDPIRYLDAPIRRRKAFANSAALGLSVLEISPKDAKARGEILALADHLVALTEKKKKKGGKPL
ncbi:MAG: AAA family ATPase [Rhodospirillaceae bacterium]|nr:AAA family ATPase [Rhodospirillaceae bacterium]